MIFNLEFSKFFQIELSIEGKRSAEDANMLYENKLLGVPRLRLKIQNNFQELYHINCKSLPPIFQPSKRQIALYLPCRWSVGGLIGVTINFPSPI